MKFMLITNTACSPKSLRWVGHAMKLTDNRELAYVFDTEEDNADTLRREVSRKYDMDFEVIPFKQPASIELTKQTLLYLAEKLAADGDKITLKITVINPYNHKPIIEVWNNQTRQEIVTLNDCM